MFDHLEGENDEAQIFEKLIDPSNQPKVRVRNIHIDGLQRTKDDLFASIFQGIFKATEFRQLLDVLIQSSKQLNALNILEHFDVTLDTTKGEHAGPNDIDIHFTIKEGRPLLLSPQVHFGNNEGEMLFTLQHRNLFGRAERLNARCSYGKSLWNEKQNSWNLEFVKPIAANIENTFKACLFNHKGDVAYGSYNQTDNGASADFTFPSFLGGKQSLRWEGIWRYVSCLPSASFTVREEAGHSLKSSFKHEYVRDSRDRTALPRQGHCLRVSQEVAGLAGGDVRFIKEDLKLQLNKSLPWDMVLCGSFSCGLVKCLEGSRLHMADKFVLGGPMSIRGFQQAGIGPHQHEDALGGNAYWAGGLHLLSPLPFLNRGNFTDFIKAHLFINAGNLQQLSLEEWPGKSLRALASDVRWSYGLGLVLPLGGLRLELNYCLPWRAQSQDRLSRGLQFGVGLTFEM